MDQSLSHRHRHANLLSFKLSLRLGVAVAALGIGFSLLPVQAQAAETGVNAVAATAPVAKPQLFVNAGTGKDDPSAGRNEATPFKTIAYALQQAKAGTVVQLAPGLYTQETGEVFPLVVPQGVTLQGSEFNQGSTVTVMGGSFFSSSWWGSQNVALLAKPDSQVVGLTITNPNSRGTGIWLESTNAVVRGCTLTKSAREGVFVAGKANPMIENNLFLENSANGVALTGMSTGMVRNNTFQKTGFGIAVSEKAAPQLVNNRVQDNVDGIVVSHTAAPQLRGNIVEGSKRDGLVAIAGAQPDLGSTTAPGRNIFRNNGRFAIYNATLKNTLAAEGNDVTGNMQLAANGPTSVDQNTPPELQAGAPAGGSSATVTVMSVVAPPALTPTPAAAKSVKTTDAKSTPTAKAALDSVALKQALAKAPTVQYKGKTYVLLENLMRLTQ
jgi:parallel beta-helix repeat protein